MSEEILFALTQLYGLISKQNNKFEISDQIFVKNNFLNKLNEEDFNTYYKIYEDILNVKSSSNNEIPKSSTSPQKISVKDSVLLLNICKKINKDLTFKQKIIVLLELYEFVKSDVEYDHNRIFVINTVSIAFNIDKETLQLLEYIGFGKPLDLVCQKYVLILDKHVNEDYTKFIRHTCIDNNTKFKFIYLKAPSIILFSYTGGERIIMNGIPIKSNSIHLFMPGGKIKTASGISFYFSEIIAHFKGEFKSQIVTVTATNISFQYSKTEFGLRNLDLSESTGNLIGIMGSSGSGKTTLLNILAGIERPTTGYVSINGSDIFNDKLKLKNTIGYISQDDLLIEELSVFENLFFHTQLSFKNKSKKEIETIVDKTLENLSLLQTKDIQVGNIFNKKISGGQRKRLNIALELIREPSILYVDEPTSGLSSSDSENVIDLLKELTLKGKLIFVVIHQPSSDVFKIFDKILILDKGGYIVYNGPPIETVSYFKKISKQIGREKEQCNYCGNVNPEQILNLIEEKVVDEFGLLTNKRKKNPLQWHNQYLKNFQVIIAANKVEFDQRLNSTPSRTLQWYIYLKRDFLTKLSNKQYIAMTILEAPLLALFLALIIRYKNDPFLKQYLYRYNENIPAYIFMCIIVSIFIGLSISAAEIIKDRKNFKREEFLNLSRFSYLLSKIVLLFLISAIQTLLFVLIGNSILEIKGMTIQYWSMLFSLACMANMLGLIISTTFSTTVTAYITIPLLLIPQMILSGAMFNFDKLNDVLRKDDEVPIIADFVASRWAFEGLIVEQFINNEFEKLFYKIDQIENISNFNLVYLLPKLKSNLWFIENHIYTNDSIIKNKISNSFILLSNEFAKQIQIDSSIHEETLNELLRGKFTPEVKLETHKYIEQLTTINQKIFSTASKRKQKTIYNLEKKNKSNLNLLKDIYFNEALSDLVRNVNTKNRIIESDGKLIPKTELIYFNPIDVNGHLDYRSHFFSPEKHLLGIGFNTFYFNLLMVWLITGILYIILYFNILKHIIKYLQKSKTIFKL